MPNGTAVSQVRQYVGICTLCLHFLSILVKQIKRYALFEHFMTLFTHFFRENKKKGQLFPDFFFSGGALRWSILVGKQKHNVQKLSIA